MSGQLPATEPVEVLISASGVPVPVPASIADALRWSGRKWALMVNGLTADQAERVVRREMRKAQRD